MIQQHRDKTAWLWGLSAASLLWIAIFLWFKPRFDTCDDAFILRAMMGSAPGGAPDFHPYVHFLWVYPLRWLSRAIPGVPWFSVVQIGLLWLSAATSFKSIVQCVWRAGHGTCAALLTAACFTGLYGFAYCARPTYTITAGMLAAAAAAQLMSIDCKRLSDRAIVLRALYALLLAALGYGLRQLSVLPALLYCGIAFLYQFFTCFGLGKGRMRSSRPMVVVLIAVAAVMGALVVGREAEIVLKNQQAYMAWQQARTNAIDYMNLLHLPAEGFESIGWSKELGELFISWFTMDEKISTEALAQLYEQYHAQHPLNSAYGAVTALIADAPEVVYTMIVLLIVGAACLIVLMVQKRGFWAALAILATGAGCLAQVAYLAWGGRMPYRALMPAVLPAAALVFCLFAQVIPKAARPRRVVCALLAVLAAVYVAPKAQSVRYQPPQWEYDAFEDMDIQANAQPDTLFIYGNGLSQDLRMFPGELPTNLMFWGGWLGNAPECRARLTAFGIDPDHLTASDWLRPCVRYLALETDAHLETLLAYLRHELGNVQAEKTQLSAGLFSYRFYLNE